MSECNEWFRFGTINLFRQGNYAAYKKSFVDCCSINSYNILSDSLDRVTPHGRHKGEFFCAGSTITADKCHLQLKPLHVKRKRNESMYTTFPRPYKIYFPGGTGH